MWYVTGTAAQTTIGAANNLDAYVGHLPRSVLASGILLNRCEQRGFHERHRNCSLTRRKERVTWLRRSHRGSGYCLPRPLGGNRRRTAVGYDHYLTGTGFLPTLTALCWRCTGFTGVVQYVNATTLNLLVTASPTGLRRRQGASYVQGVRDGGGGSVLLNPRNSP